MLNSIAFRALVLSEIDDGVLNLTMRSTPCSLAPGLESYTTTPILAVLVEGWGDVAQVADWCVSTRGRHRGECAMTRA